MIDNKNKKNSEELRETLENTNQLKRLDQNVCSKQCCKHVQWPVPHAATGGTSGTGAKEFEKYIGTNLTCNLGSGSGCLCVTKDDFNYLANRSNNASTNICTN